MKKVGIITLNGYKNHGNRLQNYALEQIIISLGYEVETIVLIPISSSSKMSIKNKIQSIKSKESANTILVIIKVLYSKLINIIIRTRIENKREKLFKDFSDKYLNESEPILATEKNLEKLNKKYDKFVVGSDQVWNPNIRNNLRNEYFLTFADRSKRIAYAASFGVENLKQEHIDFYQNNLKNFKRISVREFSGIQILNDLYINDCVYTIDPTLLIDSIKWEAFNFETSGFPKKNYILVNILGKKTKAQKKYIKKLKPKRSVVDISNYLYKYYTINPTDFLNLLKNADFVITDSFHTGIFSYIFSKKFTIFYRGNMNSRIISLYKIIYQKNIDDFEYIEFFDYVEMGSNKYLSQLKKESYHYLRDSLNLN